MKKDAVYHEWKQYRRQVDVPADFADGVMQRLESQASHADHEMFPESAALQTGLLQWSAAAGLILLGLFRMFYIAATLLRPHLLMP